MFFAGNFSHGKKYEKTNWMCLCGPEREVEGHIIRGQCEEYGDLRAQFGKLEDNLVMYFQAVLDRRDSLEEEDRRQQSSTAAVGVRFAPGNRDGMSRPRGDTLHGYQL